MLANYVYNIYLYSHIVSFSPLLSILSLCSVSPAMHGEYVRAELPGYTTDSKAVHLIAGVLRVKEAAVVEAQAVSEGLRTTSR